MYGFQQVIGNILIIFLRESIQTFDHRAREYWKNC